LVAVASEKLDLLKKVHWDLDAMFNVPPELLLVDQFSLADDALLLKEEMSFAAMESVSQSQTIYSPFDEWEAKQSLSIEPIGLVRVFAWMEEMSYSSRRIFVWAIFQRAGRMLPGRFLRLARETAFAFGVPFGKDNMNAILATMFHAPSLTFLEWTACCKVIHALHSNSSAFELIWDCFGLKHHLDIAHRNQGNAANDTSMRGKLRINGHLHRHRVKVAHGILALRARGEVIPKVSLLARSIVTTNAAHPHAFSLTLDDGTCIEMVSHSIFARDQWISVIKSNSYGWSANNNRFGSFDPH
jgi:hypothetical protein